MKKNRILKIGLLALALTLVTASLVSGTFAKYVTTVNGTGTVTVAKWDVKVGKDATSYAAALTLANTIVNGTANGDVAADRVAPGTTGKFSLVYDTSASEVAHNITITLESTSANGLADLGYLKVKNSAGTFVPFTGIDPITVYTKNWKETEPSGATIVDVEWVWVFSADETQDGLDTEDGLAAVLQKALKATFTATQLDVYSAT